MVNGSGVPLALPKLAKVPFRARQSKLKSKVDLPTPSIGSEQGVAWRDRYGSKYDTVITDLNKRVENGVKKLETVAKDLRDEIQGVLGGESALWTFIFGGNDDFFIDKVGFNR